MLAGTGVTDAVGRFRLPGHLRRHARLADEYDVEAARRRAALTDVLDEAYISHCRVEGEAQTVREVLGMLRRRPYAR